MKNMKKRILPLLAASVTILMLVSFASGNTAVALGGTSNNNISVSSSEIEEDEGNSAKITSFDVITSTDGLVSVVISAIVTNPILERMVDMRAYLVYSGIEVLMNNAQKDKTSFSIVMTSYTENVARLGYAEIWVVVDWTKGGKTQQSNWNYGITITDDDISAPNVQIEFTNANGNPLTDGVDDPLQAFAWSVADPSGFDAGVYLIHDGGTPVLVDASYTNNFPYADAGTYELPQEIGTWQLKVVASDLDSDRAFDGSARVSYSDIITVIDDDVSVDIINLSATASADLITITFTDVDYSGINTVGDIIVDDFEYIFDYSVSVDGSEWAITFSNIFILDIGLHSVGMIVTDADDDRPYDHVNEDFFTTFEITEPLVIEWADAKLDELKSLVLSAGGWNNKNNPNAMVNKIDAVIAMKECGEYEEAIEKLVHDIFPKLTGKWIVDTYGFEELIDSILSGLEALVSSTPIIRA